MTKEDKSWREWGISYDERKRRYEAIHGNEGKYWNHPDDYRNKRPEDKQRYTSHLKAVNEFEEMLMVNGITRYRFGQIVNVKGSTIKKYVENPEEIRVIHIERLADFVGVEPKAIFQLINEDYARKLKERGEYEKYWRGQGS